MHTVLNLLAVFFARHWLVAITNAALTALLGLGLIRLARRWRALGFSTLQLLRLRRFVLLAALYKGALFLLLGVSLRGMWQQPLIFGLQIPDPRQLLGLVPTSSESIWHPAAATEEVSLLLLGISFVFLGRRAVQLVRAKQALNAILRVRGDLPPPRISDLLQRAAAALPLPTGFRLPTVILAEVEYPTPMLVGVSRPYILLSPALASILTDAELDMALRHELAHFRQHDHWWRWLFTWLEDVGRLNLLSHQLGVLALDLEEELCDRSSVHSPQEAVAMAAAITKTVAFYQSAPSKKPFFFPEVARVRHAQQGPGGLERTQAFSHRIPGGRSPEAVSAVPSMPDKVLPALLGRHTRKWSRPSSLRQRLETLLTLSRELSSSPSPVGHLHGPAPHTIAGQPSWINAAARGIAHFCFGLLLFVILYAKFYIAVTLLPFQQ